MNVKIINRRFLPLLLVLTAQFGFSQVNKPKPEITYACASAAFNNFKVDYQHVGSVDSGNSFILELSDKNGDFSSAVTLKTVTDKNAETGVFEIWFSLPTTVGGTGYRFRVRSTSTAKTSDASDPIPLYYKNVTSSLVINGLTGTINVCSPTSTTITVDNFPGEPAYIWYRTGTKIAETSSSLTTNIAGTYFVEVDYGPNCSGGTISNAVTVNVGTPSGAAINGVTSVALCPTETYRLEANVNNPAFDYTWYKGAVPLGLAAAGAYYYDVDGSDSNFEGDYSVEVSGTTICTERTAVVAISKTDGFNLNLGGNTNVLLLPGETKTLSITTDAVGGTIKWYRNSVLISGANTTSLSINQDGIYKVVVDQTSGCVMTKEIDNIQVSYPNSLELTIVPDASYVNCESTNVGLSVGIITAKTTSGDIDVTSELKSLMSYQWYKNSVVISGATSTSHAISSYTDNDLYHVIGMYNSYSATSPSLDIKLAFINSVTISSPDTVVCDGGSSITITSDITDASYTYEWYRNNAKLPETTAVLSTNLTGTYQLLVKHVGCTIRSNELVIAPLDESAVSIDAKAIVVIPEGNTKQITASGADSYTWYNAANDALGTGATFAVSEEGEYTLVALIGTCQVFKKFAVEFQESFSVPNVITPNGDGIYDLWVLPNTYSNDEEITITIYNENGVEVFKTNNYQNNWPESSTLATVKNLVYYYKIDKGGAVSKQGTITIIR